MFLYDLFDVTSPVLCRSPSTIVFFLLFIGFITYQVWGLIKQQQLMCL